MLQRAFHESGVVGFLSAMSESSLHDATRLAPPQRARLERFDVAESVDIHCHILPGVDDGPATLEDSLLLARALVRDGITMAIATPHQLGRYDGRNLPGEIRR